MRYNYKSIAPIVLFVYNRPWHTQQTLEALEKNGLASDSILYIFADGPKETADQETLEKISETRKIVKSKQWCKKVIICEKEKNSGLANSITSGVTEVVNKHGKIIVLEDDIVTSKGFLKYMNDALEFYENQEKVFHISGYMYPHHELLPETFFFNVPLCWGWATWKRSWSHFKYDSQEIINHFDKNKRWKLFNKFGGAFLEDQIRSNNAGTLKTWFIKWHGSVMMQNGFSLFPQTSLVNNIGFDSSGAHSRTTDRFKHKILKDSILVTKIKIKESKKAEKIIKGTYEEFLSFNTNKKIPASFLKKKLKRIVPFKKPIKSLLRKLLYPIIIETLNENDQYKALIEDSLKTKAFIDSHRILREASISEASKLYLPFRVEESNIDAYTYIATNSKISKSQIGKFCSIGPNFQCGWGIHPTSGISTSPMFYSTLKQNGITLSKTDKIEEKKLIVIGNDVFIGANVLILDGVEIGDGAIIGAGAVVSKNIPPYAIAVGNPIKIIKYRFESEKIEELLKIKWWDFEENKLNDVEKFFFQVDEFILKYTKVES